MRTQNQTNLALFAKGSTGKRATGSGRYAGVLSPDLDANNRLNYVYSDADFDDLALNTEAIKKDKQDDKSNNLFNSDTR